MFASMRGKHEKIDEKKGGKGHYRAVAWKEGGADKKLDTPVSGLESACTRWRPGSSPWRPSRRGSA